MPAPLAARADEKHAQLRRSERAQAIALRPVGREPVLGALVRDLRRAERLVASPSPSASALRELGAIDARLRERHSEQLAALLKLGPRTKVDAPLLDGLIRDAEAECRALGAPWTPPVLLLAGLDAEFPVEREALATILGNLLRN